MHRSTPILAVALAWLGLFSGETVPSATARGLVPVAELIFVQPEPEAEAFEVDAVVAVAGRRQQILNGVRCGLIAVERTDRATNVGVVCDAGKAVRGSRAVLEAAVFGPGDAFGVCRDRGRVGREGIVLSCQVRHAPATP